MRINLNVPYVRKEEAKFFGAKWDPERKTWFVHTDDVSERQLEGLRQFIPAASSERGKLRGAQVRQKRREYREKMSRPVETRRTDDSLPDCGCLHVAPWDDCDHTAEYVDPESVAILRDIARNG